MANVSFKKGLLAKLPSTYAQGTFYVTTDERALYLDVDDSTRIRLGDFQEFATLDALKANTNPSTTALYYVTELNCLAKWNGTSYVQINLDTGATSVEVVGDGNAITSASYDPETRKLTLTKGATYTTASDVESAIDANNGELVHNGTTYETIAEFVNAKTAGIATDAALGDLQTRVGEAEADITALQEASHTHENDEALASITSEKIALWDAAEANAKTYADTAASEAAATVQTKLDEEVARAKAAEEANAAAAKAAQDAADAKVASVSAGDASVTIGGTATSPTVAAKISQDADNALSLAEDGLKVVVPAAAEYSIVKDEDAGEYAAIYHLTKDGVNVGAAINIPKDLVVKSGSVVDDEIVLVLNDEAGTEIKIPVGSLIEYVTSGSAADDMVVISVSDDHKVTATITDGSITLAKLSTDIQTAIGKAHSHENADVLDGITAEKVAAWDSAEANAKAYADDLNTAMDTRVKAVEAVAHSHENSDVINAITAEQVTAWDSAEQNAKDYADSLAVNYDAAGSADTALADAKTYADSLATNYDAAGSAETAEENAKAYADSLVATWGEF